MPLFGGLGGVTFSTVGVEGGVGSPPTGSVSTLGLPAAKTHRFVGAEAIADTIFSTMCYTYWGNRNCSVLCAGTVTGNVTDSGMLKLVIGVKKLLRRCL